MAAVNYTVRLDESDKQVAERVFNELGLTMAAGLNVYVKMVARQRRIPFDLALDKKTPGITREQKERSVKALTGLLAGHEVDLDREREERILSK
ncbi:MAG: type II toxin-antitoxin system RelB/DinJ family antitoxin [Oscillospiraceae bacterium]|nr:type II toxin-antitoxin system RelB/DinJ family antitoxin [Oscillospiraceae bacterium]